MIATLLFVAFLLMMLVGVPIGAALATWGSVLCKTSAPTSEQQPTPQLCCVAGRSDDGADVLAVLEQLPAPSPGEFVDARTTFKKPSKQKELQHQQE